MLRKVTDTAAWCAPCREMHPKEAFGKASASASGLHYACKVVTAYRNKSGHKRRGEQNNARHKLLREKRRASSLHLDWALKKLISDARRRAKARGLAFSLTLEDLQPIPATCPVLGLKLVYQAQGRRLDASASLDRIDSDGGYTASNVWVVSWRANQIKNAATLDELRALVRALDYRAGRLLDGIEHNDRPQVRP